MTDVEDLKKRIEALEAECRRLSDLEDIRRLRHQYWRCVRDKLWGDFLDLFAENGVVDIGGQVHLEGKKAIEEYYRDVVAPSLGDAFPQGGNEEIDVTGDATATGLWILDNPIVDAAGKTGWRLGFSYEEEYVRENGTWKIGSQKITNIYKQPATYE